MSSHGPDEGASGERIDEQVRQAARTAPDEGAPVPTLADAAAASEKARADEQATRAGLVAKYGNWLFWVMVIQIIIADTGFFLYGFLGVSWKITPSVMNVWLGATVIEVIGVVLVITRSLFPVGRSQPK